MKDQITKEQLDVWAQKIVQLRAELNSPLSTIGYMAEHLLEIAKEEEVLDPRLVRSLAERIQLMASHIEDVLLGLESRLSQPQND